mgnify:CR=1 FL=1
MALFNWSERFMLGIPEIDQQHKMIVYLINQLNESREAGRCDDNADVVDGLISYTKTHLLYEENLLKQHEYPDFTSHKSEHDQLVKETEDLQKRFYKGETDLFSDIAILLNDWLSKHILEIDKKYVPYLENKETTCIDKIENFNDVLIGIKEIDSQHTQALELFNVIIKAKEEKKEDEIINTVTKLIKHWEMHFKYEEDLMEKYEYSGLYMHKKVHDRIMNDFLECEKMHSEGFKYVISSLVLILNFWIDEHIKHVEGDDKRLAKYLNSKGVT